MRRRWCCCLPTLPHHTASMGPRGPQNKYNWPPRTRSCGDNRKLLPQASWRAASGLGRNSCSSGARNSTRLRQAVPGRPCNSRAASICRSSVTRVGVTALPGHWLDGRPDQRRVFGGGIAQVEHALGQRQRVQCTPASAAIGGAALALGVGSLRTWLQITSRKALRLRPLTHQWEGRGEGNETWQIADCHTPQFQKQCPSLQLSPADAAREPAGHLRSNAAEVAPIASEMNTKKEYKNSLWPCCHGPL